MEKNRTIYTILWNDSIHIQLHENHKVRIFKIESAQIPEFQTARTTYNTIEICPTSTFDSFFLLPEKWGTRYPFKCENDYMVLALGEETAVQSVVGSIVWAFRRVRKAKEAGDQEAATCFKRKPPTFLFFLPCPHWPPSHTPMEEPPTFQSATIASLRNTRPKLGALWAGWPIPDRVEIFRPRLRTFVSYNQSGSSQLSRLVDDYPKDDSI